jgi:threonine-phosphate decarboxylase
MHLHGGDIYRNKEMIDFSSNINMLGLPENIIQAACEGVRLSYGYPDVFCEELREALSEEDGIAKENIICGNGAADLIFGW